MNEKALKIIIYTMIFIGIALMIVNIVLYLGFIKKVNKIKNLKNKSFLLYFPFTLLILFLIGYILVSIISKPDIVVSSILFGGSIYVFVLLIVIYNIVNRVADNDKLLRLRYNDMRTSIARLTQNSNFVIYVNLTNDLIIEKTGAYAAALKANKYTDFLKELRTTFIEKFNDNNENLFTRDGLIEQYNHGHTKAEEIVLINRNNKPFFVKLEAELAIQPETNNIMAFIVERDYNHETVNDIITNEVLEEQYDSIFYFHNSNYQVLVSNSKSLLPTNAEGDFNEFIDTVLKPISQNTEQLDLIRPEYVLNIINGTKDVYETVLVLDNGTTKYKKCSFYSIHTHTNVFIMIVNDITEEHIEQAKLNDRLSKALIEANKATKAKSIFFSNMSHDIRTPMNAIVGFAELSKETDDINVIRDYLNKISASSKHLLEIINEILEMSRIESGKMELIDVECNLNDIMNDIYNMFYIQMEAKNLKYTINKDIKHPNIICDKNRLNRVLINLINNAYKFTKEGSVIVSVKEEGIIDNYATFKFSVKDTGIGMNEEFSKKIYNAFERERTQDVENIQGTGLGMAITKSIVDMMNGTIDLKTEYQKGSEFIVTVSFKLSDKKTNKENDIDIKNSYHKLENINALVAEDNEINREIIRIILSNYNINMIEAVNGKEAYDLLSDKIDIILTDIQMPVMNGYEFANKVRTESNYKDIPILALTADAFKDDYDKAMNVKINDVVTKPIDMDDLFKKMLKVLNK